MNITVLRGPSAIIRNYLAVIYEKSRIIYSTGSIIYGKTELYGRTKEPRNNQKISQGIF